MSAFTGADKLVCYLTGASAEGLPQRSVLQSLGRYRSGVRASFLSFFARRSIRGIRVDWISPSCLTGEATIQAAGTDAVTFAAPNGKAGPPVAIAYGETKLIHDQNDVERYVLVTRTSTDPLYGHTDLQIRAEYNNVVSGNNIRYGDITNAVMFVNHDSGPIGGFKLWTPPLVTDLENASQPIPGAGWEPTLHIAGASMPVGDTTSWFPDTRMIQIRSADDTTILGHVAGILDAVGPNEVFWISAVDPYGIGGLVTGQTGERVMPVSPLRLASEVPQIDGDGTYMQDILSINDPPPTGGGISAWNYGNTDLEAFWPLNSQGIAGYLNPNEAIGIWLHKLLSIDDPIVDAAHVRQAWTPNIIDDLAWEFFDDDAVQYIHHSRGNRRQTGRYSDTRYLADLSLNGLAYTPIAVDQYIGHPQAPDNLPNTLPFAIEQTQAGDHRYRIFRVNEYGMQTIIGEYSLVISGDGDIVLLPPSDPVNIQWVQDDKDILVTSTYYAGADGAERRADNWIVSVTIGGRTAALSDSQMNMLDIENLAVRLSHPNWQPGETGQLLIYVYRSADGVGSNPLQIPVTLGPAYSLDPTSADQFAEDRRIVP